MNKIFRMLYSISVILLIVFIVSGCQAPRKPGPNVGTENNRTDEGQKTQQERKATEINQEVIKGEEAADSLVGLTGIDDATVIFWGDKAVVAVIVSGEKEGILSEELREKIINTVKGFNPNITEVDIATDKKTFDKLDDIQQSMIRGEQIKNLGKDIEGVLNKIKNTK
ncbi:YhcN/YlaJ family sporulation lipoprotein [Proteiniborus sp. MB09-C3]|uniref:YhcN/YlaJ family sporulation lipoprotein n=1 Tax=Proteiniborus sp. MB09-C3 TaxID=3050072 RepID=UPI002554297C|nr:YhcN/YlaJ family sporulation lipoprotein [Proteiniborus sp. MB09-C3]WIV11255.1 YhcN/YlaJ family sporulation lipoprotein [Proteiniborus sp. MB09-C3]